jgi:hypothetical protein
MNQGLFYRVWGCTNRLKACLTTDPLMVAQLTIWRISLPLLKRALSTSSLVDLMASPPARPLADANRRARIADITNAMATGGRVLVSTNCLERSLVLYRLLSQADANPVLVLGLRGNGASGSGHAWVELNGEPLGQQEGDTYVPIVAFGRHGQARCGSELHSLV